MAPPPFPTPGTLKARLVKGFVDLNTVIYRLSRGRVGGSYSGAPVLLLDHVGRKSGQARTSPLCYTPDGQDVVVVASAGGADHMPAWWLNLQAQPSTTITIGTDKRAVLAREATGSERDRLWALCVANYADFDVYRERTARTIPVVVLSPA